jgi:hypothetical protein
MILFFANFYSIHIKDNPTGGLNYRDYIIKKNKKNKKKILF